MEGGRHSARKIAPQTVHRQSLPVTERTRPLLAVKLALPVGHCSSGTDDLADSDEAGLR